MKNNTFCSKEIINVAFILSVICGLLDSLLEAPSEFYSMSFLLFPTIITSICYFISYSLLLLCFNMFLNKKDIQKLPAAISLGILIEIIFLKYSPLPNYLSFIIGTGLWQKIAIFFLCPLVVVVLTYYSALKIVANEKLLSLCTKSIYIITVILLETLIFLWLLRYNDYYNLIKYCFYLFVIIITISFFLKRNEGFLKKTIYFICLAYIFGTFISFIGENIHRYYNSASFNNHKIKHIILVIDDTLRADALSCYNRKAKVKTPNIDNFSKDSFLFENAISSASWTLPAIASIMTGFPPSVHVVTTVNRKLSDNFQTLAERLQKAGYLTSALGYNAVLNRSINISQGFSEYNFFPKWYGFSFGKDVLKKLFSQLFISKPSTEKLTDMAINWLKSNKDKDFFLWLHYFDPHLPYSPPHKYLTAKKKPPSMDESLISRDPIRFGKFKPNQKEKEWIKTLYKAEVSYVDDNFGRLINALKNLNLYDNSLIIFTSDHGEEFWEHNGFEHGHTVYNELLKVPLLIKMPHSISQKILDIPVSTSYLMPTILDQCGIKYEKENFFKSLSPLLSSNITSYNKEPIISINVFSPLRVQRAITFNGFKYISVKVEKNKPTEELYNLADDPLEKHSIADIFPEKVEEAKRIFTRFDKTSKELREKYNVIKREEISLNKNVIRELKTLGYIH
ncbi:MAG: hypothetical protein D6734_06845 [Candidatus Schekmanbacteria bacterium]|nr:MAG: hypothetical protein D6734_06845 [Candidatus Schekmanbacteria bacterium]